MSRHIRSIPCASNGSFIGDGGSSSTRKQEKNISGTCFCGQSVVLLQSGTLTNPGRWFIRCPLWKTLDKYFVWVDEIDSGWEGLSRALIGRTTEKQFSRTEAEDMDAAQLGTTREIDLKIIMKMRKIHGEIKTVRVCLIINAVLLVICLGLYIVQLRNN
ncbi:hypothetical protein PIB30_058522 [Stylosanthes scabra]|uniref:GRF-type domain-containing protein n=1 Tax=Stylosanthes scabra TaxID=79078 RepID=A0ABU6YHG8_9FABA|nr:hypothetical protein [Stylosanthes scabra]